MPAAQTRLAPTAPVPATRGWRAELAYISPAYVVYLAGRWSFTGDASTAQANAGWIWRLEQATGTAVEAASTRPLAPTRPAGC